MRAGALAIAVVIAGCRGKSAPAKAPPPHDATVRDATMHDATVHDAPAGPPPFYAALFEPGAAWKFDVEHSHGEYDEHDKYVEDVDHLVLSCHVETVERHGDTDESDIVCDEDWPTIGDIPMSGTWSKNPRGLWIGEVDGDPLIANPPAMWERAETDQDSGATLEKSELTGSGDVWCWHTSSTQGDTYWERLCLGPSGPTEGGYGHSAAAEYSTTFTRVK